MSTAGRPFRLSLRHFVGDALLYGGVAGVSRVATILIVPLAARSLTVTDFGILDTLWTMTTLALLLGNGGIDLALTYYYHNCPPERRAEYVVTGLLLRAGFGVVITAAGLVAASMVSGAVFGTAGYAEWVAMMLLVVPFTLVVTYSLDLLRNERRRSWFVLLSAARLLLLLAAVAWLYAAKPADFVGALLLLRILPEAVVLLLVLVLLRGSYPLRRARRGAARDLLAYGLPMVPANLLLWLLGFVDRWHLYDRGMAGEAGEYAMAVKVGMLLMLLVAAVQMAFNPLASALRSAEGAGAFTARAFALVMTAAMTLVLLLCANMSAVLLAAGGGGYAGADLPAAILLAGNLGAVAAVFFATGANLEKRTIAHAYAGLAAVVIAVAGCRVLLPLWGPPGVAVAIAAGHAVYAVTVLATGRTPRRIPFALGRMSAAVAVCATLAVGLVTWGFAALEANAIALAGAGTVAALVLAPDRVHPGSARP